MDEKEKTKDLNLNSALEILGPNIEETEDNQRELDERVKREDFNLDSVLETLGPYGRYNLLNYVLVLFPVLLSSFFTCGFIFEAQSVTYRCEVEECETNNNTDWTQYAIPRNAETDQLESCVRYVSTNPNQCQREHFTNDTEECHSYVYENRESLVKEFDLGCQEWKRVLVGTVHNFGMFVTMLFTGAISDRFGRRVAVGMAATASFIFGISRAFSYDYLTYLVLHFVEAAIGGGLYQSSYVFAVELVSSKQRVAISAACSTTFVTGVVLLSLLAWAVDNWRTYIIVLYTPALIVTIYVWFMKESARWLISKGKTADAVKTLRGAAKINNIDHTKLELRALSNPLVRSENENRTERSEFSKAIRSSIIWKRLLICSFLWLTCSLVYYGFSINAVSLSSNKYLSFILVALVEIPAYVMVVIVLNKYGRKRVIMVNYFICAVTSFLFAFLPRCDYYSIPIYLVGKWCVTLTYSSVYIYVSEVFPTSMRQTLISFCSTSGKIGSLIAPLTPLLSLYHKSMPTVLFGSLCFAASLLTVLLPETRNTRLPDTIEEAEEISRNKGKSCL